MRGFFDSAHLPWKFPDPSEREVGESINDTVFPCPVWGCITLFVVDVSGPTTLKTKEMSLEPIFNHLRN